MSDPFGFGTNLLGVTTRPVSEPRVFTSSDTWAVDCTSAATEDGTDISAEWANELTGNARALARANGTKLDGITKIVAEDHADNMILNAVLHLLQRGRPNYAADTGTQNALAVTLNPAPAELLSGMRITVLPAYDNTGACTIVVNGAAAANIVDFNGLTPQPHAFRAGRPRTLEYVSGTWQLASNYTFSPVLIGQSATIWVRNDGNDNNDGSANDSTHALATLTAALSQAAQRALGGTITVRIGVGATYAAPTSGFIPPILGTLVIQGDASNQDSYIIAGPGSANGATLLINGNKVNISGVQINNTSATGSNHTLAVLSGSLANIDHVTLTYTGGVSDTLSHLFFAATAQVSLGAGCKISGSKGFMFQGQSGGSLYMAATCNLIVVGSPTFTDTVYMQDRSGIYVDSGASITGSATGTRYGMSSNSVVLANGAGVNFFPGTVSGVTSTGAQYVP
jgi:hypothetical protein